MDCRPDRLAQAVQQWQADDAGYIGVMRAGTEAHDMKHSPWFEPLGVLHNKQYYMYASGGMYGLSAEAVQLLTSIPIQQRRLSGACISPQYAWCIHYTCTVDDACVTGLGSLKRQDC